VKRNIFLVFAAIIVAALLSTCSLFGPIEGPIEIPIKSETFSLAWDPPTNAPVGQTIISYKIYVRARGASTWEEVATVDGAENPSVELAAADIGIGLWEFAVSTITDSGEESEYHSSIDHTADPITGWYISLTGSK
jgi:hypothetical protein